MTDIICNTFDYRQNLEEQRSLFVDCFPENIGTIVTEKNHYIWKFHSIHSKIKSYEYTAYIDDTMVGYYAAVPYKYKIADKTYQIGMVCDVMTNSLYRGKGIFTKLGAYSLQMMKENNVPFTMGYPIRKEVLPGHLKVGWKIAFKQPLYMKFLNTKTFFREKQKQYFYYFINPFIKLYNLLTTISISKKDEYLIKTVTKIEDVKGYDELISEWSRTILNTLDKSLEFAEWRYGAPEKKYIFIGAYKNDTLVGFCSIREIIKEGVPSLGILDFIVLPTQKKCLSYIHNKIIHLAKLMHKEIIMTMMSSTSASNYKLIRHGYLRSPFTFNVIINKLNPDIDDSILFDEKKWHLMFVDSDDL
jgi:hypothetical protein